MRIIKIPNYENYRMIGFLIIVFCFPNIDLIEADCIMQQMYADKYIM